MLLDMLQENKRFLSTFFSTFFFSFFSTFSFPQQEAVLLEMRARGMVADKRLLSQEDVYHGALEDILIGLKAEPYRRADAVRRSNRKRGDHRLSRTVDDGQEY